jgi:hypothetical protein
MKQTKTLAERWLWLGVTALAVAGIFAIILVVARTPQLAALTLFQQLFSVALVVHVDLSVLMWFIAMLGLGTSLLLERYTLPWRYWPNAAWITVAVSTALIAFSPLDPQWDVIKSNYIPVLQNRIFLLALGVLAAGLVVLILPVLAQVKKLPRLIREANLVELSWLAAGFTTALALVGFYRSGQTLPMGLPLDEMYEQLFWVGGHILQFSFSLLMMGAWLALLNALDVALPSRCLVLATIVLMVLGAFASLLTPILHASDTNDFVYDETRIMIELGAVGSGILAVLVVANLLKGKFMRANRAYLSCLLMSLTLFAAGSFLGVMIVGQNVTIPAHYHGMIVGITLALMGYAYSLLPRFGYPSVAHTRLAFWQPIIYGIGQLMHIGGLGYSGGYGVLRKTPGAIEGIGTNVKIALGIMGLGGTLAIIGGILFVVVMLRVRWLSLKLRISQI